MVLLYTASSNAIPGSLLWVTEHLISLLDCSEQPGTLHHIVLVLVRVELERQSPVGSFDVSIRGTPVNS